jgi:hypothetical protein
VPHLTVAQVYEEVQRRKDGDYWQPDAAALRNIAERLMAELSVNDAEAVEATVRGLGWVAAMAAEHDLEIGELIAVPGAITRNIKEHMAHLKDRLTFEDGVDAGVGGALYTGLWMGLILGEGPTPKWDGWYEAPGGQHIPYYRCGGGLVCWDCWRPYGDHPSDMRERCLTVLCNGWRVKL